MIAVMLSIQPKWCELIASGQKTVEVRKTKPKIDVPFKCYIYCTQGGDWLTSVNGVVQKPNNMKIDLTINSKIEELNGKVIGEFVCDTIDTVASIRVTCMDYITVNDKWDTNFGEISCLSVGELGKYLGFNKDGYAWHISDLVIYDKPKELSEFHIVGCKGCRDKDTYHCKFHCIGERRLKRPPQSWCYFDELKGETE